jgi:hypothetical protein
MWTLATVNRIVPAVSAVSEPQLDVLMLTEFLTAILTLLFWLHQKQSRSCVLAFGICLMAMAVYAFIQGAWPIGMVTCVWSAVTVRRWLKGKDAFDPKSTASRLAMAIPPDRWESQSRFERMYNSN